MAGVDGEHDGGQRREMAAAGLGLGFLGEQGERGEGEQQGDCLLNHEEERGGSGRGVRGGGHGHRRHGDSAATVATGEKKFLRNPPPQLSFLYLHKGPAAV